MRHVIGLALAVALAGTALLAGICVAVRRVSPLAAGLPGLALIAWTVVYGFNVARAVRYIPLRAGAFGDGFEAMLFNGLLAVAGVVLVVPLLIPSRWRSRAACANPAGPGGPGDQYVVARGPEPAPATTSLLSDWDQTAPYPTDPGELRGELRPLR